MKGSQTNAGTVIPKKFEEATLEELDRAMGTNATALWSLRRRR
jgi:short-subunit dehydrogenase